MTNQFIKYGQDICELEIFPSLDDSVEEDNEDEADL